MAPTQPHPALQNIGMKDQRQDTAWQQQLSHSGTVRSTGEVAKRTSNALRTLHGNMTEQIAGWQAKQMPWRRRMLPRLQSCETTTNIRDSFRYTRGAGGLT